MINTPNQLQHPSSLKSAFVTVCVLLILTGCDGKDETTGSEFVEEAHTSTAINKQCDSDSNPGIDCDCITKLVDSTWHDDPDLDMAMILTKSVDEFSQASIDVIIDVAIEADNKCVN